MGFYKNFLSLSALYPVPHPKCKTCLRDADINFSPDNVVLEELDGYSEMTVFSGRLTPSAHVPTSSFQPQHSLLVPVIGDTDNKFETMTSDQKPILGPESKHLCSLPGLLPLRLCLEPSSKFTLKSLTSSLGMLESMDSWSYLPEWTTESPLESFLSSRACFPLPLSPSDRISVDECAWGSNDDEDESSENSFDSGYGSLSVASDSGEIGGDYGTRDSFSGNILNSPLPTLQLSLPCRLEPTSCQLATTVFPAQKSVTIGLELEFIVYDRSQSSEFNVQQEVQRTLQHLYETDIWSLQAAIFEKTHEPDRTKFLVMNDASLRSPLLVDLDEVPEATEDKEYDSDDEPIRGNDGGWQASSPSTLPSSSVKSMFDRSKVRLSCISSYPSSSTATVDDDNDGDGNYWNSYSELIPERGETNYCVGWIPPCIDNDKAWTSSGTMIKPLTACQSLESSNIDSCNHRLAPPGKKWVKGHPVEICTPILSQNAWEFVIPTLFESLQSMLTIGFNDTTGLHIHIGCGKGACWSLQEVKRIIKAVLLWEDALDLYHPQHRLPSKNWGIAATRRNPMLKDLSLIDVFQWIDRFHDGKGWKSVRPLLPYVYEVGMHKNEATSLPHRSPGPPAYPSPFGVSAANTPLSLLLSQLGIDAKFFKYNFVANAAYGTIEFRQSEAHCCAEQALEWINIVITFVQGAMTTNEAEFLNMAENVETEGGAGVELLDQEVWDRFGLPEKLRRKFKEKAARVHLDEDIHAFEDIKPHPNKNPGERIDPPFRPPIRDGSRNMRLVL